MEEERETEKGMMVARGGASAGLAAVAAREIVKPEALRGLTFGGMLHVLELAGVLTREQAEALQAGAVADTREAVAYKRPDGNG